MFKIRVTVTAGQEFKFEMPLIEKFAYSTNFHQTFFHSVLFFRGKSDHQKHG